jgi:hypothetical protein
MSEKQDWLLAAQEVPERDPREFPYGYNSGSSFVLAGARLFFWFRSVDDLVQHLVEIEPRVFELEPGDGLEEYQAAVKPILDRVKKRRIFIRPIGTTECRNKRTLRCALVGHIRRASQGRY